MTQGISSAEPQKLLQFSSLGLQLESDIAAESARLAGTLQQFEAQCAEPGCQVGVGGHAQTLSQHGTQSATLGDWVGNVARGFLLADSGSLGAAPAPSPPALPPGWQWPWPGIGLPWLPIVIGVLPFLPWLWPIIGGLPWVPKPAPAPTVPGPQPIPVPTPAPTKPGPTPTPPVAPTPGFSRSPVPPDQITKWQPFGDTAVARADRLKDSKDQMYRAFGGNHPGIDLKVPDKTPITSPISGTGKVISVNGEPYNYGANRPGSIVVDYGDFVVVYGHTSKSSVKVGDEVQLGDSLGLTGTFNDAHLHLEVLPKLKGQARPGGYDRVDPLPYLPPELQQLLRDTPEYG